MRRLLFLCPFVLAGCQSRDVDTLAKIGRLADKKLEEGFGISPEVVAGRTRGLFGETGVAGRVRVRLQNDKHLQDAEVDIGVPSEGVIRLRATVPDAATRQRILDLARATTGVEQVIDEMKLAGE